MIMAKLLLPAFCFARCARAHASYIERARAWKLALAVFSPLANIWVIVIILCFDRDHEFMVLRSVHFQLLLRNSCVYNHVCAPFISFILFQFMVFSVDSHLYLLRVLDLKRAYIKTTLKFDKN